ncbi:alpha/beta hydrolase [Actinoplanes sp. TRM 88003]|uniref:Alpha/beta hydrolase n=1 Tax=Paractinoplanes aksuensis TaxID=2939490 RepID=A0ABT1DE04_9ACTN|nr:alpha/beta fold hydrolase [Actinoplanes aksuensis]MCO8269049.1 alpha/beta hydrolase [Actinoplanes aksuensis]
MAFEWSTVGTVVINGVRLGYRECGDTAGVPAVLLHGTGSSADTWDRLAPQLVGAGHRVIAIDLRGHAASDRTSDYRLASLRDDVLGLIDHFDLSDVVLIGHSVGAYAALAAAQHSPHLITRLVLEDLAAPPRWGGVLRLMAAAGSGLPGRSGHALAVMGAIVSQLVRPDPEWWARLGGVRQPTLVLSGGPTSCIPPRRLAEMTAAIPGARLATIPVGHRVHSLAPEAFHAEVMAFLNASVPARWLAPS